MMVPVTVVPPMPLSKEQVLEIHSDLILKGQLSMEKDVILTGRFEGQLQTLGRLTVSPGGVAVGSIEAGALVLEPGNLVEAQVKIAPAGASKPRETPRKSLGSKWPSFKKLKELALGRA
jgi:hypothetical protein